MDNIYKLQADVCKIFANDKRLQIINLLKDQEMSTGEIMRETGMNKVNISQHMNVLKSKGVVVSRREGQQLFYSITNPKIIQACTLMREVLVEQHMAREKIVSRMVKGTDHSTAMKTDKNKKAAKR